MNKNDSDDLEIEENVINFYTEDQARDLKQKLTQVMIENLSPNNCTTESVAIAIELMKQMYLDDDPFNKGSLKKK